MFNHFDVYLLEKEYRKKESDFITEIAHQELLNKLKETRQSEVSSHHSLRYLVGETMLKISGWLTSTSKLKEI